MKVLVIEGSRTEALRTRLILERDGLQVVLAADGVEGITQAAGEKPDVILLNTVVPKMAGYEVYGRLRLDPQTTNIPVVLLGALEEKSGLPVGAQNCFLAKPIEPIALIAKVKEMGNGYSASVASDAQVRQLKQELEKAKKTRSDLLANMSHELRTPLHEIIGMSELLTGTSLTGEQQSYLVTVRTASNALLSLVNDIIEFSEVEAGEALVEQKEFNLADPIERTIELMSPRAAEKGLSFTTAFSAQVPKAFTGDPNRLRQVLSALVANAIKFTDHGEVTVRVDADWTKEQEAQLHFQVSDTGIGIPQDRREIIFEPFQQADISVTRRFGGMGMGLAIAKQLVTLMGGRIWVESGASQGSVFHFTVVLKRRTAIPQIAQQVAVPSKNWPRSLQILVAEDSPTNQLIARSSLKKAGHTVAIAANGLEAVKAYEAAHAQPADQQFELILMDVSMPEMDGLEATRRIREIEKNRGGHIVIVAMTAFATKEYHEKCLESGMDAYVTKPVRIDELNHVIEPLVTRVLPASSAPAEPPAQANLPAPVDLKEALEVVGDDVDILREAVELSLAEVPTELALLKQAMIENNAQGVEAKAHRLKGVMGNIGGLIARDAGQKLETMGEQGNLDGGAEALAAFESAMDRVVAFYRNSQWEQQARQVVGGV